MTEEKLWEQRFRELAQKAYNGSCYLFTPFLGLDQIALFCRMKQELSYAGYALFGGVEGAERAVIRFGDAAQLGYEEEFPIVCLTVRPRVPKFAEELTHRDFLGALMNLGIERGLIGDIAVKEGNGYIFCLARIADYIRDNLTRVRHTDVRVEIAGCVPQELRPTFREETLVVSSERIDAVAARLFHLSRSQSTELFRAKKIFVNGSQCENGSYLCRPGDVISVRGYGKFRFCGAGSMTGKGRCRVQVKVYC